jgi:hypothetical protein
MWFERLNLSFIGAILVLLVACSPAPADSSTQVPDDSQTSSNTAQASDVPSTQSPTVVPPTTTATPLPSTPTPGPTLTPTAVPKDLSIAIENVHLYPVPYIFSGDLVTFQIQPHVPDSINLNDLGVEIYVDEQAISVETLSSRNLAGQAEGIFTWVWDTTGHPGDHAIRVGLDSEDLIQEGDEVQENN